MSAATTVRTSSDHHAVIRTIRLHGPRGLTRSTRVATWNVGDGRTEVKMRDLRQLVRDGVTVMGWQEASDRAPLVVGFLREHQSWRTRHDGEGAVPGADAVPILFDGAVWVKVFRRSVTAVPRSWVGPKGAGPTYSKPKIITLVRLRHLETGEVVTFLCTHPIPSVTRLGLPTKERRARRRHYRRHMARIVDLVQATDDLAVLFIDANATRSFGLLRPLKRAGLTGWTRKGTHGRRAIDHVLTRAGKRRPDRDVGWESSP